MLQQQQKQIDEAINKAQNDVIHKQAEDYNVYLAEFDEILQPIIDACTKDSISTGKYRKQFEDFRTFSNIFRM